MAIARPRSPEPPVTSAARPVRSTAGSADGRQRRDPELARTLAEPLEHFLVQRDALGAALLQLLGLRQPGIEDALLPWRRRRRAAPRGARARPRRSGWCPASASPRTSARRSGPRR